MTISDTPAKSLDIDDEEVRESMFEVLEALLDAMPMLDEPAAASSNQNVQGTIDILTQTPTRLSVVTDLSMARKLAVGWSLVGDDGTASEEDAVDAMSEFTNLVAGSMKFLFVEESALGLPMVEAIEGAPVPGAGGWVDIDHPVGYFQVELHSVSD